MQFAQTQAALAPDDIDLQGGRLIDVVEVSAELTLAPDSLEDYRVQPCSLFILRAKVGKGNILQTSNMRKNCKNTVRQGIDLTPMKQYSCVFAYTMSVLLSESVRFHSSLSVPHQFVRL